MKPIRLFILFSLLSFIVNGQTMRPDCDTIVLKDGTTYHGVITVMSHKTLKFISCDSLEQYTMAVYFKDIKILHYNGIKYNKINGPQKDLFIKDVKNAEAVNTTRYIHCGIIPYQFLTRSTAIYFRYDYKKVAFEYRPSYTYATNLGPNFMFPVYYNDNFYFQGINNSFLFYFPHRGRTELGIILSYKHWWHGNKPIYNDVAKFGGSSYDYFVIENRSTIMNGVGLGLEFDHYRKMRKKVDFNFFWSFSLTYFSSYSHVYSESESYGSIRNYVNKTYPYTETKDRIYFNLTCGFKIGYKKKLK